MLSARIIAKLLHQSRSKVHCSINISRRRAIIGVNDIASFENKRVIYNTFSGNNNKVY